MAPTWTRSARSGRDMMFRTCTVQVNLDFGSEADMVQKLRVSLALQPLARHSSPIRRFWKGKPNGFLSFRRMSGTDTDNARAGMLPFVFEDGFGFERYVEYALDVPMYFVMRDGKFVNCAGESFRAFLEWPAAATARRIADAARLGRSSHHDFPGSAAEEISGNARLRCGQGRDALRASRFVGRAVLQSGVA